MPFTHVLIISTSYKSIIHFLQLVYKWQHVSQALDTPEILIISDDLTF